MFSGAVDKTPTHRPLINIYRMNGEEIGKKLLGEGFERTWNAGSRMIGATESERTAMASVPVAKLS